MKKISLLFVLVFLLSSVSIFAQNVEYSSSRLSNLANNLKRQTVDLADRAYRDYKGSYNSNNRTETESVFLAYQLDSSAALFQDMVRDNRRSDELRDAAAILDGLARRAPSFGGSSYIWRNAQRTIDDIQRELGGGGGGGGYPGGGGNNNYTGMVTWRGMVDNVIQIDILDRALGVRTISGVAYGSGTYNFTSALPRNRNLQVWVVKKKGRGDVRVLRHPSTNNNGGAVIEVKDSDGGAREYELEIYWR